MLIDWITGLAGGIRDQRQAQQPRRRSVLSKKVCYLALVAVGMVVDYLILSALVSIGISLADQLLFWYDYNRLADYQ